MRQVLLLLLILASAATVPAATNGSGARLHSISTSRVSVGSSQSPSGATITIVIGDTFDKKSTNASGAVLQSDIVPRTPLIEATPTTAWFLY